MSLQPMVSQTPKSTTLALQTTPLPCALFLRGRIHLIVPRLLNVLNAPFDQSNIAAGAASYAEIEKRMQALAMPAAEPNKIPQILHFVFGLKQVEEFPFYAKIALLSALHHNPGWRAMFHYTHEPTGKHWQAIKPLMILNRVPSLTYAGNAPMRHYAHKADVLRLLALYHIGGAYLDIDTLTLRSFEPLRGERFVMGQQRHLPGQPGGLCNAIMLGARGAGFAKYWLENARHCRSKGKDWVYDFNAVKLPAILAYKKPELITVLKPRAFFEPLWDDVIAVMYAENHAANTPILENFAVHLWNNMIKDRLDSIDEHYIKTSNSLYAQIARPVAKAAGEF